MTCLLTQICLGPERSGMIKNDREAGLHTLAFPMAGTVVRGKSDKEKEVQSTAGEGSASGVESIKGLYLGVPISTAV